MLAGLCGALCAGGEYLRTPCVLHLEQVESVEGDARQDGRPLIPKRLQVFGVARPLVGRPEDVPVDAQRGNLIFIRAEIDDVVDLVPAAGLGFAMGGRRSARLKY